MDRTKNAPLWVRERACALANAADPTANWQPEQLEARQFIVGSMRALMLHIAEHEEPPVDPLLVEAREISAEHSRVCGQFEQAAEYRAGKWDDGATMRKVLIALRRGMELASTKEADNG